jgi:NAD(P)-dependent dehydrogenase (short-subunit alcohol dehydrogenase family)
MKSMSRRLAGKRAVIVGGTSGIGLAAAQRFLDEGAVVVIAGLDAKQGSDAEARLREYGHVRFCLCDAVQPQQVASLFADATRHMKGLDLLFHVAGGSGRRHGDGPLHECTDEGWEATLQLNLTSSFLTNREAVRWFLARKQAGVILNTASVVAFSPSPQHFDTIAYTAAKGAIISMSRLAAARYAGEGIRVNVLAPGLINTPMSQRAMEDEEIQEFIAQKQPLFQGAGQPMDCAEAAAYLCSDAARGVTGLVLPVDGGWTVM